jgi:putative peptidoglycan lipid II flippase
VGVLGVMVAMFGLALVPFTGYMMLQRGFYALQDTKTPALITSGVTAVGIAGCVGAVLLLPAADIVIGVAGAYATAYTVGLVASALILRRRLGRIDGRRLTRTHLRVAFAAAASAACAAATARTLAPVVSTGWGGSLIILAAASIAGVACYLATARLVGLTELRLLTNWSLAPRSRG